MRSIVEEERTKGVGRAAAPDGYVFAEVMAQRNDLRARFDDLIDLSLGEPDRAPPAWASEVLLRSAERVDARAYPQARGSARLRRAFAAFYERRYGVQLDPDKEILPLAGTKEAFGKLALVAAGARRPIYVEPVCYPAHRSAAQVVGAPIIELESSWANDFQARLPAAELSGGLVFVASPGNPTGSVLSATTLRSLAHAARARGAIFCHDAAYAELAGTAGTDLPLAIPSVGTAGVVELHSLSKSFSLAGWRVGFAVGDAAIISELARVKLWFDAGLPSIFQEAAATLLERADEYLAGAREHYLARQRKLRSALAAAAVSVYRGDAGLFCWAWAPDGDAHGWAQGLLGAHVLGIPGQAFGVAGQGALRFSVTTDASEDQLTARLIDSVRRSEAKRKRKNEVES